MSSLGSNSFRVISPTLTAYLSRGYTTNYFLFWTHPTDTKGFKYWTQKQPLLNTDILDKRVGPHRGSRSFSPLSMCWLVHVNKWRLSLEQCVTVTLTKHWDISQANKKRKSKHTKWKGLFIEFIHTHRLHQWGRMMNAQLSQSTCYLIHVHTPWPFCF